MLGQHYHDRIDTRKMLRRAFRAPPRPSRAFDLGSGAAIGAEAVPVMPPGKAQSSGEERCFVVGEDPDRVERRSGVGMRLLVRRKAWLAILNPEEEIGSLGNLPF
jgi:hypothetical protein